MIEGLNSIKYLSKSVKFKEKVSSSHRNFYHKDFKYENDKLSGLIGFGSIAKPYKGFLKNIHLIFTMDFQKDGKGHRIL